MAIDIKALVCPQCGASDVEMVAEAQGLCKVCGAKIAVQPEIGTQNVYNEVHVHSAPEAKTERDREYTKQEILPEKTKDDFLRKCWIELAKEDAPIEIFSENSGEVKQNDHQVIVDSLVTEVSYQSGIGYDRQEPYIAYETYYEEEPYIAYENYYENGVQRQRQVTKYKRVQKQRQVTRYRKVTDWSTLSGKHTADTFVIMENCDGEFLDQRLFGESHGRANRSSIVAPSDEHAEKMVISEAKWKELFDEQADHIYSSVAESLPGDHYRELNYHVEAIAKQETLLYYTPEYEVTFAFGGKTYCKYAFPFGSMEIGGDKVENEISLDAVTEKMRKESEETINKRKEASDGHVWKKTGTLTILTLALLALSVVVSLFVRVTLFVILAFAAATAGFVFNLIKVKSEEKAEDERECLDIRAEKARLEKEISEYADNYKIKQREALNNKLKSLGFQPVSADEL